MPDHLHALLSFPADQAMSEVVGAWKRYQSKQRNMHWQANYFDHRIRSLKELDDKAAYIRYNPVVKNLCAKPEDWPWFYCGDP
jgi:putative transposase